MTELIGLFLRKYWAQTLFAILVVTDVIGWRLYSSTAAEYLQFRSGVGAYAKAQEDHNAELREKSAKITEDTTNGWKAAVDYLHARPVGVLKRACAGQMPGISSPATGAYESGQGAILTPARIEADAAEAVLTLNRLQDWIEQQEALQ